MSSLMHTIYEVVDASVNHSSGSSKTLRVKLTVSPEPSSKKECPLPGQGEGSVPGAFLFKCCYLHEPHPSAEPAGAGHASSHLTCASHYPFPKYLSPPLVPGYQHCSPTTSSQTCLVSTMPQAEPGTWHGDKTLPSEWMTEQGK